MVIILMMRLFFSHNLTGRGEKAELFNSFFLFASVFIQKGKMAQPIKSNTDRDRTGIEVKIGKELVRKYPSTQDELESPGPDGLHPRF